MNALFLGDSITQGFDLERYFPGRDFVNHGIAGHTSADVLEVMHAGWFSNRPDVVFLCIGTNDLAGDYQQADTLNNIRRLLGMIREYAQEGARIYLTSLFPTRHNPPRPNPVINDLNAALHKLAWDEKTEYLHLNPFFKDYNGQLRREFTDDGLHLNMNAYQVWVQSIQALPGFL